MTTCTCDHGVLCDTGATMKTQRDEALRRWQYDQDDHSWAIYQKYDYAFQRHITAAQAKRKETAQ
jgi:hypothetical protein